MEAPSSVVLGSGDFTQTFELAGDDFAHDEPALLDIDFFGGPSQSEWALKDARVLPTYRSTKPWPEYRITPRADRFIARFKEGAQAEGVARMAELGLVLDETATRTLTEYRRFVYEDRIVGAQTNPFVKLEEIAASDYTEVVELDWYRVPFDLPDDISVESEPQWNLDAIGVRDFWPTGIHPKHPIIGVVDSAFALENSDIRWHDKHYRSQEWLIKKKPTHRHLNMYHGMAVANVLAAKQGSVGIDGVAAGFPVLAAAIGFVSSSVVTDAIEGAFSMGARLINLSVSCQASSELKDTIANAWTKGALLVAGAGQDNAEGFSHSPVVYPAAYPQVMAVGAFDKDSRFYRQGYYGGSGVDLLAPGVHIPFVDYHTDSQRVDSGTSFAAPHVTGVAALLQHWCPNLNNCQLREIIESSCTRPAGVHFSTDSGRPLGWNRQYGYGLLSCPAAFAKAKAAWLCPDHS